MTALAFGDSWLPALSDRFIVGWVVGAESLGKRSQLSLNFETSLIKLLVFRSRYGDQILSQDYV